MIGWAQITEKKNKKTPQTSAHNPLFYFFQRGTHSGLCAGESRKNNPTGGFSLNPGLFEKNAQGTDEACSQSISDLKIFQHEETTLFLNSKFKRERPSLS